MITLLYHDVIDQDLSPGSGFCGGDADIYKLTPKMFTAHLAAIAHRGNVPTFTFDDGGIGAIMHTADLLESHGWRGTFLITTDWIGSPGFLHGSHLRTLSQRGHRIGSHSCSHPPRMSACRWEQLLDEWGRSRLKLQDILGEDVQTASVPGGYYSLPIAQAASRSGLKVLFTSEPRLKPWHVEDCTVHGRYSVMGGDSAARAAALASADLLPRLTLSLAWNTKKALKRLGGDHWLRARKLWLRRRDPDPTM